jgi:D-alanyl-D-alanine carboxypeptidase
MKKKKQKKVKTRNVIILGMLLILIILTIIFYKPVSSKIKLRMKGYESEVANIIYDNDLTEKVLEKDFNILINKLAPSDEFNLKYIDDYYEIEYLDRDNFLKEINSLLDKKYSIDDINLIEKINNKTMYDYLIENKIDDLKEYSKVEIFKPDRIERYIKNKQDNYEDTVLYVNMDRDKAYFEDPNEIKDYNTNMIVNKHNKLDENFEPELVKLDKCVGDDEEEHYLSKEAKEAYDKLCDAITSEGYHLGVTSSYRSYKDQTDVYNYYLRNNGQSYVDKYVATPGYSEHQTGLALDVKSTISSPFKTTREYTWMINNAYKYGFILRYPEEKLDILGYNYESWHYRYVGEEAAKIIQEKGLIYEEYYALYIDK